MPATKDRLLLIKNGRLLDPASKTDAQHDLLLQGPRIVRVGPDLTSSDAEVF